jgi:undecaprenyl-diphosphatase
MTAMRLRPLSPRPLLIVATLTFLVLAASALTGGVLPADVPVRDALVAWAGPTAVAALRVANLAGDWRVLLPGTLLLILVFPQARRRWWVWLGLMIAAPLAEGLLKPLIARPRPEEVSLGFPSGHVTAVAAFCSAVIYLADTLPHPTVRGSVRLAALALIVLVAVARVVLKAHWPSDALGGIALGLALAAAAALLASAQEPDAPGR